MSTESENIATLKDAYQRWHDTKAGSVDHWLGLMTDDVQFRSLAAGAKAMQFTQTSSCKDEVKQYFSGLTAEWEMIYYRFDEYTAQDDRVVARGQVSFKHKKSGKTLVTPKADFHKFRNGKICEFFEFFDTAAAIGAASND
jgi:ketosteroid isomerase-like protein